MYLLIYLFMHGKSSVTKNANNANGPVGETGSIFRKYFYNVGYYASVINFCIRTWSCSVYFFSVNPKASKYVSFYVFTGLVC